MAGKRASAFEDDLDLSGFAPKTDTKTDAKAAPRPAEIKAIAKQARFHEREVPLAPPPPTPVPTATLAPLTAERAPRRYRTGRNRQINIKASDETINALYAIADAQGWVLGETLERALGALQRELNEGRAVR